jgi:inner membrane transporter RhtA
VRPTHLLDRSPAVGLIGLDALTVQFGAAFATRLFGRVGPAGAVTLRLVVAALVLLAGLRLLPGGRGGRRLRRRDGRADWAVAVAFGLVMGAMNLCFYESIARIPLGVAVTIEFSGPLCLALASSRHWLDGLWALAAGSGVALLATGIGHRLDVVGVMFALIAGAFWVGYIILSQETGARFESLTGLAWAMAVSAVAIFPFGVAAAGTTLVRPSVLGLGIAVGIMSSVIPYSLELIALRRVTRRAFGVMMSLDPALATAAGWIVLGQHLDLREWIALLLVVAANLGNSVLGSPSPATTART